MNLQSKSLSQLFGYAGCTPTQEDVVAVEEFARVYVSPDSAPLRFKAFFSFCVMKASRLIELYGDDGYGDKPDDLNRMTYWLQHVNERAITDYIAEHMGETGHDPPERSVEVHPARRSTT